MRWLSLFLLCYGFPLQILGTNAFSSFWNILNGFFQSIEQVNAVPVLSETGDIETMKEEIVQIPLAEKQQNKTEQVDFGDQSSIENRLVVDNSEVTENSLNKELEVIKVDQFNQTIPLKSAEEIDILVLQSEQLLLQENFTGAVDVLLTILESNPTHLLANRLIGMSFLSLDRSDLAESFLYTALIESNFTDLRIIFDFVEALKLNGKYDLAIQLILQMRYKSEFQDSIDFLNYFLGSIYEMKKDYHSAQDWYLNAAAIKPTNVGAWLRGSTILFPEGYKNLTTAELVLLQGFKYNPSNADLAFNLGSLFHATFRYFEAKLFYEESLRLNPNMTSALANLATTLHTLGQYRQALQYYEKSLEQTPTNTILLANYALCLSTLSHHKKAYQMIEKASLLDPADTVIQSDKKKLYILYQNEITKKQNLLNLIKNMVKLRQFDEIANSLDQFGEPTVEEEEEIAWWHYTFGIVEYFRRQYAKSIQHCLKAKQFAKSASVMVYSCLGLSFQSVGNLTQAIQYFEKSYDLMSSTINYQELMPFLSFNLTVNDINYNLLQSYSINSEPEKCVEKSLEIFDLPKTKDGGIIVLALSHVKWSESGRKVLENYENENQLSFSVQEPKIQKSKQMISIKSGRSIKQEVSRLQSLPPNLLNTAYNCLNSLSPRPPEDYRDLITHRNEAFETLNTLANQPFEQPSGQPSSSLFPSPHQKIILVTTFFFPAHVITPFDRHVSISLQNILQQNLNNDYISQIFLLNRIEYNFKKLKNSHKISQYLVDHMIKYSDIFRFVNDLSKGSDDLIVIAQCDISFDSTLLFLHKANIWSLSTIPEPSNETHTNQDAKGVIALTSWKATPPPSPSSSSTSLLDSTMYTTLSIRIDQQDVWIVKGQIDQKVISLSEFMFGSRRSDNRLAKIFSESGYRIYNPAFTIRAIQSDPSLRNHSIFQSHDIVLGPFGDVFFSDIGLFD